jgi:hypothetical protein
VSVNDVRLLMEEQPAETPHARRIGRGRRVAPTGLAEDSPQSLADTGNAVDANAVTLLVFREAVAEQRRDRDDMPAASEAGAESGDHAFLPADDRGVELGEHEDAH